MRQSGYAGTNPVADANRWDGNSRRLRRTLRSRTSSIWGICDIANAICKSLRDFANPAPRYVTCGTKEKAAVLAAKD